MNDWGQKLEYSLSAQQKFDIELLKKHIDKCVSITKTDTELDKKGVDCIAKLDGGSEIYIDAKTREKGCSRYWKEGVPELALEVWSVVKKKIGWTLSTATNVDYILYTFDREDCEKFFFIPFQLLRQAFYENGRKWKSNYPIKEQQSNTWKSSCMFVPAPIVIRAVTELMQGRIN